MRRIIGLFLLGLAALLPVVVLVHLTGRFLVATELVVRRALLLWLPEGLYLPGTGLAVAVLIVLLTGVLARSWIGPPIGGWVSARIGRIPVLGPIYLSLRDVTRRFSADQPTGFTEVVFVANANGGGRLGLVADRDPLPAKLGGHQELVPVYFPAALAPGGDIELVPEDRLEATELSVDQAFGMILSAGLARNGYRR